MGFGACGLGRLLARCPRTGNPFVCESSGGARSMRAEKTTQTAP
jgi:hypothetical protein